MKFEKTYESAKRKLLNDEDVCEKNRALFKRFFEFEEYKLKRKNNLRSLDEPTFKTLCWYVTRLRAVNRWFKNKPWETLTEADIRQVYDDLEDGKILTRFGTPVKDTATFYKHVLRSKPFEMAGKKALVEKVMEFHVQPDRDSQVNFIDEETFRRIVEVVIQLKHKAFLWLCWDIGENATSILQLRKKDCVRQVDEETKKAEYRIDLRREILKRARKPRTEITHYEESSRLLDTILADKDSDDLVFDFDSRWAAKILARAVAISGARCIPSENPVRLKDLRSSAACDLLSKKFSIDEVKARLGHSPASRVIDKYANYLALDRTKMKRKFNQSANSNLLEEFDELRGRERILTDRNHLMGERLEALESQNQRFRQELLFIRNEIQTILTNLLNSNISTSGMGMSHHQTSRLTYQASTRKLPSN